jgi:hypothetical protein
MFIVALFIIAKNEKQIKVFHVMKGKLWYMPTKDYHSKIKRNKYAIIWMNLRYIK